MLDYFSNIIIPIIILFIVIYGKKQKVDIYESFITGAIEGLKTAWNILALYNRNFFSNRNF